MSNMVKLAEQHDEMSHPHTIGVLRAMDHGRGGVERSLQALAARGWVDQVDSDKWSLTEKGIEEARSFAKR